MDIDDAILRVTQRRAARDALAKGGRPPFIMPNYISVVRQLPKLLQRHGLSQALACLELRSEGRPNSAYTLLARQLDRWLLTNMGVTDRTALAALASRDSQFYREASELAWLFALPARSRGGGAMNWPWRMPRDLPWATPYPLPRDTSEALLAEGRCENFSLLMDRYLAFGDNRGRLELLRELSNRRALVPDYTGQQELIAAHDARWQQTAEDLGAITFAARPHWRVIIGLGTNDLLGGGITLHPVFGFPIVPSTALKGVSRAYARWVLESPDGEMDTLLGKVDEDQKSRGDLVFLEGSPTLPPVVERDVVNPIFGAYYRDSKTPPGSYLSPSPIFFLALGSRSRYRFGVASQSGDRSAAERGVQWLQGALSELGVGAKSGAGYGYWEVE